MKLTLLGTGTPIPDPARRGPSQVVEVGDSLLLVDCGSGVVHRLIEAGYRREARGPQRPAIACIALTHLHSDHIVGLPDLLWTGWIMRWWDAPPPVAGPPGTAHLVAGLVNAFAYDVQVRMAGERLQRAWLVPPVMEVEEGWRMEGDGWRLTAFRVDHAPVDQAFGFRVDADAGSVVISGDTRPSENLIRHAQGADLLVHEVYHKDAALALSRTLTDPDAIARRRTILSYHTPSDEVGTIAARAEVGRLVLTHLLLYGADPASLRAEVERDFPRPVIVGADLQTFTVG